MALLLSTSTAAAASSHLSLSSSFETKNFWMRPKSSLVITRKKKVEESAGEDVEDFLDDEDVVVGEGGDNEEEEFGDYIEGELKKVRGEEMGSGSEDGFDDWDSEEWESELEEDEDDLKDLDGFLPAGLGYGNITEEVIEKGKKKRVSKSERKRMAREAAKGEKEEVTVCARCHSLRNYGQVKNEMAENLIPDFDFDQLITSRLMKPTGKADATVVVMVVDCVDFDGSFPKRAAKSLFKALEQSNYGLKQSKKLPKLVLVATKVDLPFSGLPCAFGQMGRSRKWLRYERSYNLELIGLSMGRLYILGAEVRLDLIHASVETIYVTVWASPSVSLHLGKTENADELMNKHAGVRLQRVFNSLLGTVEVLQLWLNYSSEARSVDHKGKKAGLDAALPMCRDVIRQVGTSLSTFSSPYYALYLELKWRNMGTTYNSETSAAHPPISMDRVSELGQWQKQEVKARGTSWDVTGMDVAVAGLGWFSLASIERPGFWLPKAISEAIAKSIEDRREFFAKFGGVGKIRTIFILNLV
ncbi:hypothetical protein HAX54_031722 [Datura stramonium]|uniref:Uncharacterized protein n=1 Tax=Datura stramonium TaxID=4076 RepID=A0ABS8SC26_DATST|nr:hypothetical protein [Datura stramonium]